MNVQSLVNYVDEETSVLVKNQVNIAGISDNYSSPNVKCVSWNVRSMVNKIDELLCVFADNDIDIACISETWLSSQANSVTAIIKSAGFNISHCFREKRGGGTAILWRDNLEKQIHCITNLKSFDTFQYQCVTFRGKFKMVILCIYRLQETSFKLFLNDLNSLISALDSSYPIVLTGDFNVHFEKSNLCDAKELEYLTTSFGLTQFVFGPTHVLGHTLDLLFLNSHDFAMQNIIPQNYNLGDHFPVFFELPNIEKRICPKKKQINCRNFKNIDIPIFATSLSVSLQTQLSSQDENATFSDLCSIYNNTVEQHLDNVAPLQTKSFTPSTSPPWMDLEYKQNRATRRRLERKWKKSGLQGDKSLYVQQRQLCSNMCCEKRSSYFSELIKSKSGDQRALFSIVNKVFDKTKSSNVLPEHNNAKQLANSFNNFYVNKVNNLRSEIPASPTYLHRDYNGTMMDVLRPVTVEELQSIIKESGIKTSYHDILPAKILKQVIHELLPHLCDLVNKSLSTGCVDGIKDSIIVPLLKKNGLDPEILKNYRPVADLVFLSKLSERVVFKRMQEHMTANNLHCKFQHGYKKNHSPETLLLRLVNDILLGMDCNFATLILLIDLSAAFDTVDIELLLNILHFEFGVCGVALRWFRSFLTGRNQRVLIENTLSETLNVDFGVPQGSVLGPVLFNIYIQSLFKLIEKCGFCTSGYADDNNAYQSFSLNFQFGLITQKLPYLMSEITKWMNCHFLKINPDKTEIILFLPTKLSNAPTINGTFLGENCIRFSERVKNLGFVLDNFLTMEPHVNTVVSFCYKLISDVGRNRKLLSDEDTESLMHAIVSSRVDYCNSLLYGISKEVIYKLQKVQNAAARLISNRKKRESVRDVLVKLHWLRIEERIIFKLLVTTFKCFKGIAPESICELISVSSEHLFLLKAIYLNSNYGRRSFSYAAPRYWNALPIEIRSASTLDSFKRSTKHLLFNNFSEYKSKVFLYY